MGPQPFTGHRTSGGRDRSVWEDDQEGTELHGALVSCLPPRRSWVPLRPGPSAGVHVRLCPWSSSSASEGTVGTPVGEWDQPGLTRGQGTRLRLRSCDPQANETQGREQGRGSSAAVTCSRDTGCSRQDVRRRARLGPFLPPPRTQDPPRLGQCFRQQQKLRFCPVSFFRRDPDCHSTVNAHTPSWGPCSNVGSNSVGPGGGAAPEFSSAPGEERLLGHGPPSEQQRGRGNAPGRRPVWGAGCLGKYTHQSCLD